MPHTLTDEELIIEEPKVNRNDSPEIETIQEKVRAAGAVSYTHLLVVHGEVTIDPTQAVDIFILFTEKGLLSYAAFQSIHDPSRCS